MFGVIGRPCRYLWRMHGWLGLGGVCWCHAPLPVRDATRKVPQPPFETVPNVSLQMVLADVVTVCTIEQTVTTLVFSRDRTFLYVCSKLIELLTEVMIGTQETLFSHSGLRVTNPTPHMP